MKLSLDVGSQWLHRGQVVEIDGPLSVHQVQIRVLATGQMLPAATHELRPVPTPAPRSRGHASPMVVPQGEWERAQSLARAFEPYSAQQGMPCTKVSQLAKEWGISPRQVLRYRAVYQQHHIASALARCPGGRPAGLRLLKSEVEFLIQRVIDKHWARRERSSQTEICERVRLLCLRLGLQPPSPKTVIHRIRAQDAYLMARKQQGVKAANQRFAPRPGRLVVERPLDLIQIDHTLADVLVVDEMDSAKVIGRPWLTLAIDVATRVVLGYYLSMDAPSSVSVAMCLAHAMLPKVENEQEPDLWPMYGKPREILVDNGKDFRSAALQRGCEQHGIKLSWRPVREPHYGAHIERLMGTFMRMVHSLPGTTFSSPKGRGDYASERHACLTLKELRSWLVEKICHSYHVRRHRMLGMPPLLAWEHALLQEDGTYGLPAMPMDREALRRDFYPFVRRRLQRTGVSFRSSRYWHEALASMIHPEREATVHYDPDDPSRVWIEGDDDSLIEATAVAGRAKGEMATYTPTVNERARLDALMDAGYERVDAIQAASEQRRRQRHPETPTTSALPGRGKRGGRRPKLVVRKPQHDMPEVPLNRASITVEDL